MKVKYIVIGVILLLISFNTTASFLKVKEEKNNSNFSFEGNILYVGGSGVNNYTKIQDAINDSNNGDTVFVYNGTYYEYNITVDKSINLIGENRDNTTIYGTNISNILIVIADWINISGFTLKNSEYAIELFSGNISISNNNISSNVFGISNLFIWDWNDTYIPLNGFVNIKDNIFWNNSEISVLINGENDLFINVSKNHFINNSAGFYVVSVYNGIISKNIYENNNISLIIGFGVNVIIKNNHIINNTHGFSGSFLFNSIIKLNNICNNYHGINIWGGGGNKIIQNNLINNNLTAEFDRFAFFETIIKIQSIGIYPNFFKNIRLISKNKWSENYWNEPRTKPYLIRGNLYLFLPIRNPVPLFNFDWHPASEPYDIN